MDDKKKNYSKPVLFSIQKCRDCGAEIFLAKVSTKTGDKWGPLDIRPLLKDQCESGKWYVSLEGSWTSKFTRNSVYFERHSCSQGEAARTITREAKDAAKALTSGDDDFDTDDIPF